MAEYDLFLLYTAPIVDFKVRSCLSFPLQMGVVSKLVANLPMSWCILEELNFQGLLD